MYLIDHMNIHVVQLNSLDGPCTLVHVCLIIAQHITLNLKTTSCANIMKHIKQRSHTGLQLTNNNDEGELSCKLVLHPIHIIYQLVQCRIKKKLLKLINNCTTPAS